jgi:16S rRNA (guanine527-N7)-methyltransferase
MPADDDDGRLASLVREHRLTTDTSRKLATFLDVLAADPHAPTAVRAPSEAVDAHLADTLVALALTEVREARAVADIGSGAGVPGLVLAAALPAARLALVESQRRKCAFLARSIHAMALENAEVVCGRVEEWDEGLGACDLVTARALAPQPVVMEYAAPLLRLGGHLVDWRGRRDAGEDIAAERVASVLGLALLRVVRAEPFPAAEHRHLHVFAKVAPTPERFPRRAGVAAKRPLAG